MVDTVANFTQLRKTLEQVAALKTERETFVKDNQRLNDQVKTLAEQLQRSRDEVRLEGVEKGEVERKRGKERKLGTYLHII